MLEPSIIVSDIDYIRLMALPSPPELRAELERAIVVPSESINPTIVGMHSLVLYRDEVSEQLREIEVVYPDEADPASGKVSVFAPALLTGMLGVRTKTCFGRRFFVSHTRLPVQESVPVPAMRLQVNPFVCPTSVHPSRR